MRFVDQTVVVTGGSRGLGAAIAWLQDLGIGHAQEIEAKLLAHATARLRAEPDVTIIGTADRKAPVLSFLLGDIHPHDVGSILDTLGIAVRCGHHCTQPVMDRYSLPATSRASLGVYNNRDDIDALVVALRKVQEMFA